MQKNLTGMEADPDYREADRKSREAIFREKMQDRISRHLDEMARKLEADRRHGSLLDIY